MAVKLKKDNRMSLENSKEKLIKIVNEELSFLDEKYEEEDFVFYDTSDWVMAKSLDYSYDPMNIDTDDEYPKGIDPKFSKNVVDYFWPPIIQVEVYHFLTLKNAERVLKEQKLRAYWIYKYRNGEEVETLHDFLGLYPQEKDKNGVADYETDLKSNFCSCHVKADALSRNDVLKEMAEHVGKDWVALKFRITNNRSAEFLQNNFREMLYLKNDKRSDELKSLQRIRDRVLEETGHKIVVHRISSMTKFTLPINYKLENEMRIFVRNNEYPLESVKIDRDGDEYLNLSIGSEDVLSGCKIELVSYSSVKQRHLKQPDGNKVCYADLSV